MSLLLVVVVVFRCHCCCLGVLICGVVVVIFVDCCRVLRVVDRRYLSLPCYGLPGVGVVVVIVMFVCVAVGVILRVVLPFVSLSPLLLVALLLSVVISC